MMKRILLLIPFLFLAACARAPEGMPRQAVDPSHLTIFHNGIVITMEAAQPLAEAIAIRGETIAAVGSDEMVLALDEAGATVIDLNGRTMMPGFVDAHTHLLNDHQSQGMSLDEAQYEALKNGITTLGTLYVDSNFLREIQAFDAAGYLRVRTSLYLVATDPCGNKQGDWWKAYPPTRNPGEWLRVNGVKIFTDGGACGKVALSFELQPGDGLGDLWYSREDLNAMVEEVHEAGYQAAVHAIGDRAVAQALNALEAALDGRPNTQRHRMEHVSVIPSDQISRFGDLGIIPVLNGQYPNCTPFGPPIPDGYREMEWPWRALRENNPDLAIAWHSDFPFLSGNPFIHLLGFTTRIDRFQGYPCAPKEWMLDDTLTVEEALSIMTIQSAYVLFREEEVGSLAPGKLADLIVLSEYPLEIQPNKLAETRVLLTVVGGRTEYCWPRAADLCPGFAKRTPAPTPDTRPPVFVRWLVAVLLVLIPLAAMFARRRFQVWVRRIGGPAGIISGAIWLAFLFMRGWDMPALFFILPPFLMALGVAGFAALGKPDRIGGFGLWMALLGALSFAEGGIVSDWFLLDAGWGLFIFGILAHAIGLFLIGLSNIRNPDLSRWYALPLVVGLLGGPVPFGLSFILPESSDIPFVLLLSVLGGGWILMGWMILTHQATNDRGLAAEK